MNRSRPLRLAVLLVLAVPVIAATAGPGYTQTELDSLPVLYRLDKGSAYEQGCFPPCLCPVLISEAVRGTFVLTPAGFDGLFRTYAVSEINWMVSMGGTDTFVTGSGTYRIGGEFALQQELTLDLQVGDGKVERYTSGLVTGPAPFPVISILISINDQTCYDTVFRVNASPVPPDQVRPYRLLAGSTFQRGCFGICDCLVGPLQPIIGLFALVPLVSEPPWKEFSVVHARWRVLSPTSTSTSGQSLPVHGDGFYTIGGDGPPQQRLDLLLKVGGDAVARYGSGLVPGGESFPRIDARVSISGATCYDTVLDLHAAPRLPLLRRSTRTDGDAP